MMARSSSDFDRLFERALDGQLEPKDAERWHEALAADPTLHERLESARALRALLRNEPLPKVSAGFAARVRARAHFTGQARRADAQAWTRPAIAAAALLLCALLPAAYWLGREEGRRVPTAEASVAAAPSRLPVAPEIARAARLTLSDLALSQGVPERLRGPLIAGQLQAFGLARWSREDSGQVAHFLREIDQSLVERSTAPAWTEWQRRATEESLWLELREREAPTALPLARSDWVVPAPPFGAAIDRYRSFLSESEARALSEVLVLKGDFVHGHLDRIFIDQRLRQHFGAERRRELEAAVSNIVVFGLWEQGLETEADAFLKAWLPEGHFPASRELRARLHAMTLPRPRALSPRPSQSEEVQTEQLLETESLPHFIIRLLPEPPAPPAPNPDRP